MKKYSIYLLSIVLLISYGNVHAQTKSVIIKSGAYYKVNGHGTIMVDENGKPRPQPKDTIHQIVIETLDTVVPTFDSLFYKGNAVAFSIIEIPTKDWNIGMLKGTEKKAGWKFQKKSKLWLIDFRSDNEITKKYFYLLKIKYHVGKKIALLTIKKEIEIESDIVM